MKPDTTIKIMVICSTIYLAYKWYSARKVEL